MEPSSIIEVYGIPGEVGHCPACNHIQTLLGALQAPYTFHKVMYKDSDGINYNRPTIEALAKRIGCYPSLSIRYPVIYVNNKKMLNIKHFKETLINLGYDQDIIED